MDNEFEGSQTGEVHLNIEDFALMPTCSDAASHIIDKLSEIIEAMAEERLQEKAPLPTLAEYLNRVKAYQPYHLKNGYQMGSSYSAICETIADEVVKDGTYRQSNDYWYFDFGRIRKTYHNLLTSVVDELAEYRTLKQARPQLERDALTKEIQSQFLSEVTKYTTDPNWCEIESIEAELTLCLTDEEKRERLATEYRERLQDYKKRAAKAEVVKMYSDEFSYILPWQCFTPTRLEDTCLDYVQSDFQSNPDNIELDLILYSPFGPKPIIDETIQLACDWLVIDWIQKQLKPDTISSNIVDSKAADSNNQKNLFNPPMSLDEIRNWFIQLAENNSENSKPFLSVEQVDQFIERAFAGNTQLPKLTLNIAKGERTSITKLFYLYFQRCIQDYAIEPTKHCKEKYVRLLTDNFTNYNHKAVFANFNKSMTANKQWDKTI